MDTVKNDFLGWVIYKEEQVAITDSEQDSCIAGSRSPTTDACYPERPLDVRRPDTVEVFHEIEQFVRHNPWFFLALGFFAGYLLARVKVR